MTLPRYTPAKVVIKLLVAEGLATLPPKNVTTPWGAWPVTSGVLPDTDKGGIPDDFLAVRGSPPVKDARLMETGEDVEHPGIQFWIRSREEDDGYNKGKAIEALLNSTVRRYVTLGTSPDEETWLIQSFSKKTGTYFVSQEPTGTRRRYFHTINYTVTLYPPGA